jgi:hypothetical protein
MYISPIGRQQYGPLEDHTTWMGLSEVSLALKSSSPKSLLPIILVFIQLNTPWKILLLQ